MRAVYCWRVRTGRPATQSARSIDRNARLIHAQNFSTGLRSGDSGGMCHSRIFACLMALVLAAVVKNLSLSHRTCLTPVLRGVERQHCVAELPLPHDGHPLLGCDLAALVDTYHSEAAWRHATP